MSAKVMVVLCSLLHLSISMTYEEVITRGYNLRDLCEECDTSTGSGYSYHPRYCHLFVHCTVDGKGQLHGQVKECTRGLLWSHKIKQCVWPSESDCPNNPCLNRSTTFRDVRNCNGYFSCLDGSRLEYNCCPRFSGYSEISGGCVQDTTCTHPCLPGSANVTAKAPDCQRYGVRDDPTKFLWTVGDINVTMTCATGTAFSVDFCSCTKADLSSPAENCEPYIHFPFNDNLKDAKGRTASGGTADIQHGGGGAVGGGTAHFRGQQQVVAWAMNNMEFRSNFTLAFRFKATLPDSQAAHDERYALVDNSDCDKEATFGVALLRTSHRFGTLHGGFRLKNGMAFTASSGDLVLTDWHDVVLLKQGSRAELRVDGKVHPIEGDGTESDIDRVDCAMTIGTGTGLQNFMGYIDEVMYYTCVPKEYL